MIRHEPLPKDKPVSILRIYDQDKPGEYAEFATVCILVWDSPEVVWVKGLKGRTDLRMLKKMLGFFLASGVKTVKANRASFRKLPGSVLKPDGTREIDVKRLARRVKLTK